MRKLILCLTATVTIAGLAIAPPVAAQSRDDQRNARAEMQAGNNISRRDIERRLVPSYERRGYEYLSSEYDGTAQVYRFKFIREGNVIWVDVDAQNARVLRVSR